MVELNNIFSIVMKVLDNRLSDLSDAADGCIDALSKKMFAKGFVSGPVKDSATSIDILLKNFKSHIKVGKSSDLERKIEDFLTILSDIGGPLAEASSAIRMDVEKEMGVPFPRTGTRVTQKARQSSLTLTDTGISERVTDSVTQDYDMEILYDTQPVPVGVTITRLDDNNHDPRQLVHASIGNGTMSSYADSQLPANQSTSEMAGTLPTSLGLDVNQLKKSTQATSSAITSPQEALHPGSVQESTIPISQVTKAGVPPTLPTPGDQQPHIPRVGTYTPPTFKHHNSCPGCDELKNLKEKLSEEQRSENVQLRKKIDDLQHALDDMRLTEKEKLQDNWKRIEEREKNLHEDKARIEEREKNLHEDKKRLRKDTIEEENRLKDERKQMNEEFMKQLKQKQKQFDTELLKKQKQLDIEFNNKCKELEKQKKKQEQFFHEEMKKKENSLSERSKKLDVIEVKLTTSRIRLDQDSKKEAEKEKELRRLQSKLTEQKQEIDEENKFLNDRKVKEIEEISKEKQTLDKREHELKQKWEEYWKQRRVLEKEKESFKKESEAIKLEKQHRHINVVQVIKVIIIFSFFLILVSILCYIYTFN